MSQLLWVKWEKEEMEAEEEEEEELTNILAARFSLERHEAPRAEQGWWLGQQDNKKTVMAVRIDLSNL